ncbi:carbonic anhydrase [Sphingomonas prati]|uniref:Carbonic anhydrase n=1 Tax=Sphingomonas prati TaxID=1843237 RepID=A0A7W9BR23_9SPHN|nr:carbonic anhydrase [Sphingomonas prati]MBB5728520.1 carbonic anhydrase [Sphingomonas prati]GGE73156.1 carbonic anhydrase [Sphingomonas prati]
MTGITPLIDGYRRFKKTGWDDQRERWETLAKGQSPKIMIIACSDSRVDPATIFDVAPGQTFVVRNVAALVPPYETGGGFHGVSSAIEFAVTQLEVTDVLVLGHASCGGCKAALSRTFEGSDHGHGAFIDSWISMLADVRDEVIAEKGPDAGAEAVTEMEHRAVGVSLDNLKTFPFVQDRLDDGRLKLHGAWFGIAEGDLLVRDPETGAFNPA